MVLIDVALALTRPAHGRSPRTLALHRTGVSAKLRRLPWCWWPGSLSPLPRRYSANSRTHVLNVRADGHRRLNPGCRNRIQTEKPHTAADQEGPRQGRLSRIQTPVGGLQLPVCRLALISTFFSQLGHGHRPVEWLAMFRRRSHRGVERIGQLIISRPNLSFAVSADWPWPGLAIVAVVVLSQLLITRFGLSVSKLTPNFQQAESGFENEEHGSANLITFSQAVSSSLCFFI